MNSSPGISGVHSVLVAGFVAILFLAVIATFILTLLQAIRLRKRGWIIGAIASGVVILIGGAGVIGAFAVAVSQNVAGKRAKNLARDIFYGPDQEVTLLAPASWKILPNLREDALIGIGSDPQGCFAMVLETRKDAGDWTLDGLDQFTTGGLMGGLEGGNSSYPQTWNIGGMPARYRRVTGSSGRYQLVYHRTTVESADAFYQVVTWTLASREDASRGQLTEILRSFTAKAGPPLSAASTPDALAAVIAEVLQIDKEDVHETGRFSELGDDLDRVEIVLAVEESFNVEIPAEVAASLATVGDLRRWLEQLARLPER